MFGKLTKAPLGRNIYSRVNLVQVESRSSPRFYKYRAPDGAYGTDEINLLHLFARCRRTRQTMTPVTIAAISRIVPLRPTHFTSRGKLAPNR
jgi:hypothetical protein